MPTPIRTAMRLALRARLATLPGGLPPVAYEFQPFTPTLALYLREKLIMGPGATSPVSLGRTAVKRTRALYQLEVRTPLQTNNSASPTATATRAADLVADALCQHFDAGLELTYDGRRVMVERSSSADFIAVPPDWTALPVTIACYTEFTSFT